MSLRLSASTLIITALTAFMAIAYAGSGTAFAEVKFNASYTLSMTGITIGKVTWTANIEDDHYTIKATGYAGGLLSVLVSGEGNAASHGDIKDGHFLPTLFEARYLDDKEKVELKMTIDGGNVKEIMAAAPPTFSPDRVPITDAHRVGISDPLSALMIPSTATNGGLTPEICNRTLQIFDGSHRFSIALSFKRMDNAKAGNGFSGPVVVCGAVLHPIAGYRPNSRIVKYVAGRQDMEIWFAPVKGTGVVAPFRILIPTLVGTMAFHADQFETMTAVKGAPFAAPRL